MVYFIALDVLIAEPLRCCFEYYACTVRETLSRPEAYTTFIFFVAVELIGPHAVAGFVTMIEWLKSKPRTYFTAISACALLFLVWCSLGSRVDHRRQLALRAFASGQYQSTVAFATRVLAVLPDDTELALLAADAAERIGDHSAAIHFFEMLPASFHDDAICSGWRNLADLQLRTGNPSTARETLERIVSEASNAVLARQDLARLLSGCGERFRALEQSRFLLSSGDVSQEDLVRLAKNGRALFSVSKLLRMQALDRSESMTRRGLIESALERRDMYQLREQLAGLTDNSITSVRCRLRCRTMLGGFNATQLEADLNKLQTDTLHPDGLILRAFCVSDKLSGSESVQLLLDALKLDPWNVHALQMLSDRLQHSNVAVAKELRQLVATVNEIGRLAGRTEGHLQDGIAESQLVGRLRSIGRIDEALAWARLALRTNADLDWANQLVSDSINGVDDNKGVKPFKHPMQKLQGAMPAALDSEPLKESVGLNEQDSGRLTFHDVASQFGIHFAYDNGVSTAQQGLKMHQWTGGGVGVVDIDADAWPDLYFTQGGQRGNIVDNNQPDAIFRNRFGDSFQSVAEVANVEETHFGQGVAVGDVNNDGFDDLYIANIGENQLLINQGDGTFVRSLAVDRNLADGGAEWTTSVAIADLNGDSLPDLYDVNYLTGDNVFTATCDHGGLQRICGPTDFSAARDRICLANGEGQFRTISVDGSEMDSRGMGLVIADVSGSGGNVIYVANDESANQMLIVDRETYTIQDVAFESGVALNQMGQAQGSMGIAFGDYDLNGLPDMFATNYFAEANVLYSQVATSVFVDQTHSSKLATPGFAMLGFGCQFFDADSDGDLDLIVANGHLDDFTHLGHPFQMNAQIFVNDSGERFKEADVSGNYFQRMLLGRAVAILDWNRDSKCDLVVTHIGDPASLLANASDQCLASISFRLIGTTSPRLPIGASIEVNSDGTSHRAWLAAGNGYQCSNERQLRLAVDLRETKRMIGVYWPESSIAKQVQAGAQQEFVIIQGRPTAYNVPR